jgi:lysophospholipase L1-like esterase
MASLTIDAEDAVGTTGITKVVATLTDSAHRPVPQAYVSSTAIVKQHIDYTAQNGTLTLDLEPNANITPANTYWSVKVHDKTWLVSKGSGTEALTAIVYPSIHDLNAPFRLNSLADVDTTGVADGDALVYEASTSEWVPGTATGGVQWLSLTTAAEWTAAVTAAMARDDNTLYLAPGTHTMPVPDLAIAVTSKLRVQGAGIDATTLSITQNTGTQAAVAYVFRVNDGVDFEIADLNVELPDFQNPATAARNITFVEVGQGSVVVPDSANVVIRVERVRFNATTGKGITTGFNVESGTGLGRLRMYMNDCDLGNVNSPVGFFGPDSGDRVLYIDDCRFRDSGGTYSASDTGWAYFGHTLYVHPSNGLIVTNCEFYGARKYTIHHYSGGGRTVPHRLGSKFTNCYFDIYTTDGNVDLVNQDAIVTSDWIGCVFKHGLIYNLGPASYVNCQFDGSNIYGSTYPIRVAASRFTYTSGGPQPGFIRGSDIIVSDTRFDSLVGINTTIATDHWIFRDCKFNGTGMRVTTSGAQIECFDCKFSGFSGLSLIILDGSGVSLRLVRCELAYYSGGAHIIPLNGGGGTVDGWGNMVTGGTMTAISATLTTTNLGWVQSALTPTNPPDLVPKSALDSIAPAAPPARGGKVYRGRIASQLVVDVVIGDSIGRGSGGTLGTSDWPSILSAIENRAAGYEDTPAGIILCNEDESTYGNLKWSSLAVGAAGDSGPSAGPATAPVTNWVTSANAQVIGDSRTFRRAHVFYELQSSSAATIQVSVDGGSNYSTDQSTTGSGYAQYTSADIGAVTGTLRVKQTSAGTAKIIGYRPLKTAGASGVVIDNLAHGGTSTTDWLTYRGWETHCTLVTPRRIFISLGGNDMFAGTSASTVQTNIGTIITRARAASPLAEIVVICGYYPSKPTAGKTGVGVTTWASTWVPAIRTAALAGGATFVDLYAAFGDCSEGVDPYTLTMDAGLHFGPDGQRAIAELMAERLGLARAAVPAFPRDGSLPLTGNVDLNGSSITDTSSTPLIRFLKQLRVLMPTNAGVVKVGETDDGIGTIRPFLTLYANATDEAANKGFAGFGMVAAHGVMALGDPTTGPTSFAWALSATTLRFLQGDFATRQNLQAKSIDLDADTTAATQAPRRSESDRRAVARAVVASRNYINA